MDISASLESRIRRLVRIRFRTLLAVDRDDAEQEALTKVLELDGTRIHGANLWPYVERVAVNAVIGMLRSKCRTKEVLYGDVPEAVDVDAPDLTDRVEAVMDVLEVQHPAWAQTARLCAERIGYDAVAHRMGVPLGTVKSRMSRTRQLARSVAIGVLLTLGVNTFGAATYSSTTNALYTARVGADGRPQSYMVTAASVSYELQPLTVTCRDLYNEPLPKGECLLFGSVVGGMPPMPSLGAKGYLDVSDGYAKGVRVYPSSRLWLPKGTFIRVRLEVDTKGRGTTDEVTVIGFRGVTR